MQVGIIGINHKSSSLALREKLARLFQAEFGPKDGVLLSTCNRTELYFSGGPLAERHSAILDRLKGVGLHALYSYFGPDCFNHLSRVISGIDSAIFGESDIQRQVKLAYENARQKEKLSHELHYLFQKGLKIGKEMRSSFLLSKKGALLPHAIHSIVEWQGRTLENSRCLFVGNSSINRKLISYFHYKGARDLTLCTRTEGNVFHVVTTGWEVLERWDDFDVVVCGTYHDGYVLEKKEGAKETLLFDLSVPRNIDPALANHPRLKLYNIDQIGVMAQKNRGEKEIALCETVIEKAVARQMQLFKKRKQAKWFYAVSC
ncbi:glutamyl-tRNA reductase [Candidatus Neptunochlamydia vexilliferae]|uniref:glutamyl-tRNA reductase n=1 Tax=Candidatus Neptunichlamydia vexilliferae TaxID=1651774 RepID=UPI001890BCC5|nr:glutamyl-tRNA reductase [Candidatus Neptunochlamydia vexilliferae]